LLQQDLRPRRVAEGDEPSGGHVAWTLGEQPVGHRDHALRCRERYGKIPLGQGHHAQALMYAPDLKLPPRTRLALRKPDGIP
jgi:hypothetical protein